MGMLSLNHLMLKQKRKSRRRIQARNGSIAQPQKSLIPQKGGRSQGAERYTYSGPNLPEDIWCHIHSLMPLEDAARTACVSHTFLRSWRRRPYLDFNEETLCLEQNANGKGYIARHFTMRVDQILENHSGIGVKTLNLRFPHRYKVEACHLNRWLQIAIRPGIEEVSLILPMNHKKKYSFPWSLLFGGCGNSIRHFHITSCVFHPPVGFNCLRNLTKLSLYEVGITGDELGSLTSNCFVLEQLELTFCDELLFLKIPLSLERLSFLTVFECNKLQVVESKAPNLFTVRFYGDPVSLSLGESSKCLYILPLNNPEFLSCAITKLPSAAPNLETLVVTSFGERVNTPMVADKFLNLKYLKIDLAGDYEAFSPAYDYLSLVSFLDASPTLETFIMTVRQDDMKHDSAFGDALHVRQIPGHKHSRLRKVQINGFCSAKSIVELACHILENATSLESLTLDTIVCQGKDGDVSGRCVQNNRRCTSIPRDMILEAHKALTVIDMHIVWRVPPAVKLIVEEPCSRCHDIDVKL